MPNLPKPRLRRATRARRARRAAPRLSRRRPNVEQIDGRRPALGQHRAPGRARARLAGGALRLPRPRPRGRALAQPAAEDRRLRRLPLHRPPLPGLRPAVGPARTPASSTSSSGPTTWSRSRTSRCSRSSTCSSAAAPKEELREQLFSRGSGYLLYRIVDDSFDYCFPMLRKIGNKLDALEDEIFEGRSEEVVRDISNVKQEIINFRKVIRPQRPVLRDLEKVKQRYLAPDLDLEIYFDDIVDAHERIWDMLENYKEVVEALEETNESVISPPRQRHPARAHLDQRHRPAADPDREHLGHERRRARRGRPGHRRRRSGSSIGVDGRDPGRHGRATSAAAAGSSLHRSCMWRAISGSGRPGASPT